MKQRLPSFINRALPILCLMLAWLGYATATVRLEKNRTPAADLEMQVALPLFMQVTMAGGDPYLASNINVFRALTVDTENQRPERFLIQAKVQNDAAWLNPRHEDNYYLAAANLSWNGQLDAAQHVLADATASRPFDMLPPFFYAFNLYYFNHDPINGAKWLQVAALHADSEENRLSMERIAARWTEKGQNRHEALKLLEAMAAQSRYASLRQILLKRAERVRQLMQLDNAIEIYMQRYHQYPTKLEALVESGILERLPDDPLAQGYSIDTDGKAQFKNPQKK